MTTTRRVFLGNVVSGVALAGGLSRVRARQRRPLRDVVVLLPGVMGSVLQKDGKDVWAPTPRALARVLQSFDSDNGLLTLRGDTESDADLGDGITADRLMPNAHLIPGYWKVDGYSTLSASITTRFDAQRGRNFFEFPYDWRRDNRVAARRLARESRRWLEEWRRSSGNKDARLVLIGHSMGGLVARYFLEVLEGWKQTRMLITFGTPFRGSLNAVDALANGVRRLNFIDLSALVRSFTSTYQLLPIYPCYDPGAGTLARVGEISGIPNIAADRAAQALAFHNEIRRAAEANGRDPAYSRHRYGLHPIVGEYQLTFQSAKLSGGKVVLSHALGDDGNVTGDGTVPRASARPIDTPEATKLHRTVYVSEQHGSLQNFPAVLDHLAGLLAETADDPPQFRGSGVPRVSLDVEDAYSTADRVVVRARCEEPERTLEATVVDAATGTVAATVPVVAGRQGAMGEAAVGPLPEGTYRVTVRGGPDVGSATDLFLVAGA